MRASYDNPELQRRELWEDGRMLSYTRYPIGENFYWWPAGIAAGEWKDGKIIGDKGAVSANIDHK